MTINAEMINAQKRALNYFFQDKSARDTGIARHLASSVQVECLLLDRETARAFMTALPFAIKAFAFKKHPCRMKNPVEPCAACSAINEFLEILEEAGIEVPE